MSDRHPFDDVPVVYAYTRAQALEDGVLGELSEWAAETGFTTPVACTAGVWNGYIVPDESLRELGQSERGRAHDVLYMLCVTIRRQHGRGRRHDTSHVQFDVLFLKPPHKQSKVRLHTVCGPGENGEPVITIMLPGED